MFSVSIDKVITDKFENRVNRFYNELKTEFKIAVVNTREDFLNRVVSILGSVSHTGGALPSPYIGVYRELTEKWVQRKIRFHWMLPIGTATGETAQWLISHARQPERIIQSGDFIEISASIPQPMDIGEDITPEGKIYMMEFGSAKLNIPARPIFRPVVVWYLTLGNNSPFYKEFIMARDRATQRIYGI